ncbi:lipid storage droplets surface-binding protein 1 [Copidosoma floridanum]|uniref:lipid storage droplets surface-binding protein 1 n=1 Tax=Copidosoma floridanum TaxID=29053 RepID=UPI0006C9974C|nr:lipid storage droplets surface-binding protein 1 [Copidosoma floridanum]
MARPNVRRRHDTADLQLESVARLSRLPIVESGIHIAGNVYDKIKHSNSLMNWSLDTAEQSLALATATALPAVIVFNGPITALDQLLCKGIEIFEQRVPAVNLSPHLMYWNTREYVNKRFVKPMLIRAGSVKQIGSVVANAAVEKLDDAIDAADHYVDRYLPADPADKVAEKTSSDSGAYSHRGKDSVDCGGASSGSKAARTIEHGARFSRKLQRRLTRRTLAEARALKEQGTECIHVLLYVVELVATDPKLALQKAKELWASLSLPEPGNQARPTNLEQLLVLFTRETARRLVHLINGTTNLATRAPRRLARIFLRLSHRVRIISEQALQMILLEGKRDAYNAKVNALRSAIYRLNCSTNHFLEQLAAFLAGRPKGKKVTHGSMNQINHNNHVTNAVNPPVNGID